MFRPERPISGMTDKRTGGTLCVPVDRCIAAEWPRSWSPRFQKLHGSISESSEIWGHHQLVLWTDSAAVKELLLALFKICYDCRRRSVVRPVVISRKLSMTDPQLLWNTIRKLTSLIPLPYIDPPQTSPGVIFWFQIQLEVKVICQKAPIPRLGVTPRGRKLYHWIPGVGFLISVP